MEIINKWLIWIILWITSMVFGGIITVNSLNNNNWLIFIGIPLIFLAMFSMAMSLKIITKEVDKQ